MYSNPKYYNFIVYKNIESIFAKKGEIILREKQQPPNDYWEFWVILAGRGFGKTLAGAHCIIDFIKNKIKKNICLIGATKNETRHIMVTGPSGILNLATVNELSYKYFINQGMIIFDNGSEIFLFSGEKYEGLRGFQFDCVWIDEFAKFYKPEETLEQLIFCCRLGDPKFIITTTPKPIPILRNLKNHSNTFYTEGSSYENKDNLPEAYLKLIKQFENTALGDQEIYGKILDDNKDSPWHGVQIRYSPYDLDNLLYKTIGVDPSVCNRNETGIVFAAYDPFDKKIIIIDDFSLSAEVKNWIPFLCNLLSQNAVEYLAIEINQGGDLLEYTLNNNLQHHIIINKFFARENKKTRAMSAAHLYSQGFIHHGKKLDLLENQMKNFYGSIDRVDALVWTVESILKNLKHQSNNNNNIEGKLWIP